MTGTGLDFEFDRKWIIKINKLDSCRKISNIDINTVTSTDLQSPVLKK